jgi:hypothetical protein
MDSLVVLPCVPGTVDLELLLERSADGTDSLEAAQAAVLGLGDWWFICNPRQPDSFYVRRFDGQPAVLAFTDERLALLAAERYGLADGDGSMVLLQMPACDAIRWLGAFAEQGVPRVMFNAATTPFPMAITDLPSLWTKFGPAL